MIGEALFVERLRAGVQAAAAEVVHLEGVDAGTYVLHEALSATSSSLERLGKFVGGYPDDLSGRVSDVERALEHLRSLDEVVAGVQARQAPFIGGDAEVAAAYQRLSQLSETVQPARDELERIEPKVRSLWAEIHEHPNTDPHRSDQRQMLLRVAQTDDTAATMAIDRAFGQVASAEDAWWAHVTQVEDRQRAYALVVNELLPPS